MSILVADVAWLATALLHRENPEAEDFSLDEIRQRAKTEFHDDRPGVWQHIVSHCVASKPKSPAQYRMLHETQRGRRRLYRAGDPVNPERRGKMHPHSADLPERYQPLVEWYVEEYRNGGNGKKNGNGNGGSSNPAVWLRFEGWISSYDLQKMSEAIREGCERVDSNEW